MYLFISCRGERDREWKLFPFHIFITLCTPCWVYNKTNETLRDTQCFQLLLYLQKQQSFLLGIDRATLFGSSEEDSQSSKVCDNESIDFNIIDLRK